MNFMKKSSVRNVSKYQEIKTTTESIIYSKLHLLLYTIDDKFSIPNIILDKLGCSQQLIFLLFTGVGPTQALMELPRHSLPVLSSSSACIGEYQLLFNCLLCPKQDLFLKDFALDFYADIVVAVETGQQIDEVFYDFEVSFQ